MKPDVKNPYGYKICYKEQGGKEYIKHFITKGYFRAKQIKQYFQKYPQRAREDEHLLKRPSWVIIPIKRSEVRAGIWREDPF